MREEWDPVYAAERVHSRCDSALTSHVLGCGRALCLLSDGRLCPTGRAYRALRRDALRATDRIRLVTLAAAIPEVPA